MSAKSFRQIVGVPPSTASTKDSVLIIIDAQNEYANGHLTVKNVAESRKAIKTLLDKYRAAGGHVVHVVHDVRLTMNCTDSRLPKAHQSSLPAQSLPRSSPS